MAGRGRPTIRKQRDYGRRPGVEPTALLCIMCEGEKTEPGYVKALANSLRVNLFVKGACRNSKEASTGFEKGDEVYWLFDAEAHDAGVNVAERIRQAKADGIRVILSNPCIEFWFLLHFENSGGDLLSAGQAIAAIKRYIPRYDKSRPETFSCLYALTGQALTRAANLRQASPGHWADHETPSTDVDLLVRRIMETAKRHAK